MCANYFKFACIGHKFYLENLHFTARLVLKSIACMALVRKAADEIRITVFFKSFGVKKINELVVTSNQLTNNFADLVTSCLGQDVACGPPVVLRCFIQAKQVKSACRLPLKLLNSDSLWLARFLTYCSCKTSIPLRTHYKKRN
jgi:hypothetical protein